MPDLVFTSSTYPDKSVIGVFIYVDVLRRVVCLFSHTRHPMADQSIGVPELRQQPQSKQRQMATFMVLSRKRTLVRLAQAAPLYVLQVHRQDLPVLLGRSPPSSDFGGAVSSSKFQPASEMSQALRLLGIIADHYLGLYLTLWCFFATNVEGCDAARC